MNILQVVFFNPINGGGGVENIALNLALYQSKNHNVTLLCHSNKNNVANYKNIKIIQFKISSYIFLGNTKINFKKLLYNIKIKKFIKEHGAEYDIIHVHGDIGGFKELKNYNSIVTFHGFTEDAVKSRNILIKMFLYFTSIRYEKGNVLYCNNLITVSENIKNKIKSYTKKKITVIYNGVNTNIYKSVQSKEKIRLRHSLNFRKDIKYILFIGKDKYIKGLDIAIGAVKKIKNNGHLNIIGLEGRSEKNISYLGPIFSNKKINYIKCSDVLIAPSRYDAFSISVLEAMSCGIPIIISKNVGVSELIKNNYNGIVLNKNESVYYAKELNKLLNNDSYYKRLSKNARITAIKNNKDVMLRKYDKIYKKILKF